MRLRIGLALIFSTLIFDSRARADECNGRVFRIDDLNRVTDFYPLYVQSRRGANYGVIGNCAELYDKEFSGPITFFIRNQFKNFRTVPVGILRIKSLRTFAKEVGPRIKLSRHAGWYVPSAADSNVKPSRELPDVEIKLSPKEWTNDHAGSDDVAALNKKLGIPWHGYALPDMTLSSTDGRGYWRFANDGDEKRQTLTNYLIRFNTAEKGENIEFYAEIPLGVKRIDLSVDSNLDLLIADYTFLITSR
jgi:hypothetical protein